MVCACLASSCLAPLGAAWPLLHVMCLKPSSLFLVFLHAL